MDKIWEIFAYLQNSIQIQAKRHKKQVKFIKILPFTEMGWNNFSIVVIHLHIQNYKTFSLKLVHFYVRNSR